MRVDQLTRYHFPQSVIETWKTHQGEYLLPLQVLALDNYLLPYPEPATAGESKGQSLLIAAPTSAGKTFCGELAAIAATQRRKKAFFLVPLKALAEEKFAEFSQKYQHLGLRLCISTRDRHEFDYKIERGDFDLAILIYEKFNQLLIKNIDLLAVVDLMVIDELQLLGDPSRGATLELALLKVLCPPGSAGPPPQIIGLSAVLNRVADLAGWLNCVLVVGQQRPVELKTGVLQENRFFFRAFNSREEGQESWSGIIIDEKLVRHEFVRNSTDENTAILKAIQANLERGEQVLCFLKGKKDCQSLAHLLTEAIDRAPADNALAGLAEEPEVLASEPLRHCLQYGVAFHHADLPLALRRLVEHFFRAGEIKVIFCTTTLALGVNLPAHTVFIEAWKYKNGNQTARPLLVPLTVAEFENMAGRAGRLGQATSGRAIMLAKTTFEREVLWSRYVTGKTEEVVSQLFVLPTADLILDLVASNSASAASTLYEVLSKSLAARQGQVIPELNRALNFLVENGLVFLSGVADQTLDKKFIATDFGKTVAQSGIRVTTGLAIRSFLSSENHFSALDLFFCLSGTADAFDLPLTLNFQEQMTDYYQQLWLARKPFLPRQWRPGETLHSGSAQSAIGEPSAGCTTRAGVWRLKLALLLTFWIEDLPLLELEQRFFCPAGTIQQAVQTLQWLVDATGKIALVIGAGEVPASEPESLRDSATGGIARKIFILAQRLKYGVTESLLKLADFLTDSLSRDFLLRLANQQISSPADLKKLSQSDLGQLLPEKVVQKIWQKLYGNLEAGSITGETPIRIGTNRLPATAREKDCPGLIIEARPQKNRFTVVVGNNLITLSNRTFRLLTLLAVARLQQPEGWVAKAKLAPEDYSARYLYELRQELTQQLSHSCPGWQKLLLIQNDRLGHYRLAVPPERLQINFEQLRLHPDKEIRQLALDFIQRSDRPKEERAAQSEL